MWSTDSGLAELLLDAENPDGVLLRVDGVDQSYVDLADPTHLEFDYVQVLAAALESFAPAGPLRVVHIGVGAGTLARYVAATRPGSRQLLVDSDSALVEGLRERLGLARIPGAKLRVGDGRDQLAALAGHTDVIIVDAFTGDRPAPRLGTAQAYEQLAATGTPLVLVNVSDGPGTMNLRRQSVGALASFTDVLAAAPTSVLRGRRRGNAVLVAATTPLAAQTFGERLRRQALPLRLLDAADLRARASGAPPWRDDDPPAPTPAAGITLL